eukprot:scaffold157848_cov33-Prasinocladus_malaysianus.AAC.1
MKMIRNGAESGSMATRNGHPQMPVVWYAAHPESVRLKWEGFFRSVGSILRTETKNRIRTCKPLICLALLACLVRF